LHVGYTFGQHKVLFEPRRTIVVEERPWSRNGAHDQEMVSPNVRGEGAA